MRLFTNQRGGSRLIEFGLILILFVAIQNAAEASESGECMKMKLEHRLSFIWAAERKDMKVEINKYEAAKRSYFYNRLKKREKIL